MFVSGGIVYTTIKTAVGSIYIPRCLDISRNFRHDWTEKINSNETHFTLLGRRFLSDPEKG